MTAQQSLEALIDSYCAAWSCADANERERLLERVWERDGRYTDPRADAIGIAQLSAHIGNILAARPGARVVRTSAVDVHHALARFAWRVVQGDGTALPEGIDFAEIAATGKLQRIAGFFGPLAARS
jgi:hypothetical protein